MARTADAGAAILYEQHPDDDAGQDSIREAEALRRGDPLALRRAAEARLDAYEAAVDEPDQTQGFGRILRLHDTAYRALLLLDLRGLELRFGTEDGEPRLHGTVTAIEDNPEDGPVLTVTLPRRPRQRKDRTEEWTLAILLDDAYHLRSPGDIRRDDEAMLRALRRCPPRPAPGTPPGDDGAPVGGLGLVPPWLAFHEAGHAVVRLALDERMPTAPAPIRRVVARRRGRWAEPYVDVDGDKITDGIQGMVEGRDRCRRREWEHAVRCGGPRLAWAREALWLAALVYLAGPAAEARWRGFAGEALLPALPRLGDGQEALDDLRRLGREDELPAAWREAWALVGDVWPAVGAVAGALREREELAGEEVGRIAAAAMPGRFPLVEAGLAGAL